MARENFDSKQQQPTRDHILNWIRKLLPAPSSALFTLFVVGVVLFAQSAGAWPLGDTAATNSLPSMIRYQGRLTDLDGVPKDGEFDMVFRLYKQQDQPVDQYDWVEEHTAAQNAQVTVDSGLFNVWLGSLTPIDPNLLTDGDLYLGVQVAGDEEMSPRERLTGVPFALLANAVADGAVTTAKLAGDAVTSAKITDNTITEDDIADGFTARNAEKLDNRDSSDFANASHQHDSRYYTEGESDNRYASTGHNHDSRYYTEGQSNSRFVNAGGDTMSGNLTITSGGTTKIEGDLQVGDNSWNPSFAGMDGNDMAVDGQFEQAGSGGARFYKIGIGRDPIDQEGSLAVSDDILVDGWIKSPANQDLVIDAGAGTSNRVRVHDALEIGGSDLLIKAGGDRGDGGRALVQTGGDTLTINFNNDFSGGVRINDLRTGKIVEENLMTPEQRDNLSLLKFTQGDLLCWNSKAGRLEKCSATASPLIVAVADDVGKPIVLGAEPVKVLGPVEPGDLLIAAGEPGYAEVWHRVGQGDPPTGVVIAKALESFEGKKGLVKAMIVSR